MLVLALVLVLVVALAVALKPTHVSLVFASTYRGMLILLCPDHPQKTAAMQSARQRGPKAQARTGDGLFSCKGKGDGRA